MAISPVAPPRESHCPPASYAGRPGSCPSLAPSLRDPEDKQRPRSPSQVPEVVSSGAQARKQWQEGSLSTPAQRPQKPYGFLPEFSGHWSGWPELSHVYASKVEVQVG